MHLLAELGRGGLNLAAEAGRLGGLLDVLGIDAGPACNTGCSSHGRLEIESVSS